MILVTAGLVAGSVPEAAAGKPSEEHGQSVLVPQLSAGMRAAGDDCSAVLTGEDYDASLYLLTNCSDMNSCGG